MAAVITPELLADMVANSGEENRNDVALTILNLLKELGIEKVTGEYRGSGDSPDGCDVTGWMMNQVITKDSGTGEQVTINDYRSLNQVEDAKLQPYSEAISEFVFNCSYDHWGGWYNNDGGHGTGTFFVKDDKPRFTIDFYQWVSSEEFEGEHTYDSDTAAVE